MIQRGMAKASLKNCCRAQKVSNQIKSNEGGPGKYEIYEILVLFYKNFIVVPLHDFAVDI